LYIANLQMRGNLQLFNNFTPIIVGNFEKIFLQCGIHKSQNTIFWKIMRQERGRTKIFITVCYKYFSTALVSQINYDNRLQFV
jgi:hypothetical protein